MTAIVTVALPTMVIAMAAGITDMVTNGSANVMGTVAGRVAHTGIKNAQHVILRV